MYWIENIVAALLILGMCITFFTYQNVQKRLNEAIEIIDHWSNEKVLLDERDEYLEITTSLVNGQLQSRDIEIEFISNHDHIKQIVDASSYFADAIIEKCDEKIARVKSIHDLYNTPGEDKSARGGS